MEPDYTGATAPPFNFTSPLLGTRRISSLLSEGQIDREHRTLSQTLALRSDRPAMQFNQVARDGESQSESTLLSRDRSLSLAKTIEHIRQEIRRDTVACVADRQARSRLDAVEIDADTATALR